MSVIRYTARRITSGIVLSLFALLAGISLVADSGPWQVGAATVRVICPMTVGGSFEAKTTALTGTVAIVAARTPLEGELSVDLRTLDSGIELRNTHMRDSYLEVEKGDGFDRAVLSDILLPDVDAETVQGRTKFSGTLLLHGIRKAIGGEAEIRRGSTSVRVDASFPVVLADFGIPLPQYLGIGVRSQVQVRVNFVAGIVAANQAESR